MSYYTMPRGAKRIRETEDGPEKYCAYCESWWPLECFWAHPKGTGGLDNRCHACHRERRTSRNAGPIALALLALLTVACNGYSVNDREATWCVEAGLYAPAQAAADEWRARSDGEVSFTLEHLSGCRAPLRVAFADLPGEHGGRWSLDRSAILIDPEMSDEGRRRVAILHELGHYLTGREHSQDPADVMYERQVEARHLTDADVARLDVPSRVVTGGYF